MAGLLAALIAASAVIAVGSFRSEGGAAAPPDGVTITASPTSGLVDGQKVTINVKARSDVNITQLYIKQCKAGVTYGDSNDVQYFNGKCPASPVSSSADAQVIVSREGSFILSRTPEGLNVPIRVGVGSTEWQPSPGTTTQLTCGPDDPCALVIRVLVGGAYYFWTTELGFVDANPIVGCGGASPAVLSSAGSDEMSDAWATWTRAFCARAGADGAPSTATFGGGEGPAVTAFASGLNDIAYTASGYDADVGLLPEGSPPRAAVAVPVALNAAVFATGGGRIATINGEPIGKVVYPTLELRAADAAALTAGGVFWAERPDRPYKASILGLNPELDGQLYYGGGKPDTAGVYAQSLPLSSTRYLTDYLNRRAPDHFIAVGSADPSTRPPTANFAQSDPSYSDALRLVSGRPSLGKVTDAAALDEFSGGPIWTITDLATAEALDLGLVALENGSDRFVEPNAASMQAAVATMKRNAQGMLQPDLSVVPSDVTTAAETDPYPLTYVVYALVPAEPLFTADCTQRAASQALLNDWLTYITGEGQAALPAGLQPLPDDLAKEAQDVIAEVGTAPVTGACAPAAAEAGLPTAGAPSSPGAIPSSVTNPLPSSPVGSLPVAALAPATTPAGDTKKDTITIGAIPAFAHRAVPDALGGIMALLGIALVSTLGLYLTARVASGGQAMSGEGGFVAAGGQRTVFGIVVLWVVVAVAGVALVVYQLGPMLQQRDQRSLFDGYRKELRAAAFASEGLPGASAAAAKLKPPELSDPVGILQIGSIAVNQVTVEGVGPTQTDEGPGHVPGTAGLGQPGNSVLIGRRNMYGGPFAKLAELERGDKIVTTTTQGQSVYIVRSVRERTFNRRRWTRLLGASDDDRLTLVTSGSRSPTNSDMASVVVAKMRDLPFEPTAQGARTDSETSVDGQGDAWPRIALAFAIYLGVLVASVFVYRRFRLLVAYLLTIAPIVAATVLFAESLSMLLPSWT